MGYSAPLFDVRLARLVKAETLEPHQRVTPRSFKTATDFRQQVMIKHPFLSDFHSRAEHLYAGLLEGDASITSYVPQPFLLRVGKKRYPPDFYVVGDNQPRKVVELKPGGKMPEDIQVPVTHFLAQYRYQFEVISNESVYEREVEAENWLEIVRILHQSRNFSTTDSEQSVLETLELNGPCTFGDLLDAGDREQTYYQEIALFRLLHRGHVVAELTESPMDYDTGVSLCR